MTKQLDYEQLIKSILKEFVETNIEKNTPIVKSN